MMPTWREKMTTFFKGDGRRILVVIGLIGIVLLALPEFLSKREKPADDTTATVTDEALERALEQRVATLISHVQGVGACQVLVTLERGVQIVYAADTASSTGDNNRSSQEGILYVDTDAGPVGLPVTRLQPAVKGVAVVCEGGGDPVVCQQVIDLVSTAFHISERRVCVAKQKQAE